MTVTARYRSFPAPASPLLVVEPLPRSSAGFLVALPILFIVYIPRPPVDGAQFLIFPTIGVLVVLLGTILLTLSRGKLKGSIVPLAVTLMLLAVATAASELSNSLYIDFSGFLTPFKPVLHLLLLLLGVAVAGRVQPAAIRSGMWIASVAVLLGQTLLVTGQILGLQILDFVYSEEKVRGIGGILRSTGSLGNPNVLGMAVVLAVLLYYGSGVRRGRWAATLAALVLIVFSGSRTMLVLLPSAVLFFGLLQHLLVRSGRPFPIGKLALIAFGLFGGALVTIYVFRDFFAYQAQLLMVLSTGDLGEVSSMAQRFSHWSNSWDRFLSDASSTKWWLGLGSRPEFRVADNDWFYTLWRTGVVGLSAQLLVHLTALFQINRVPNPKMRTVCFAFFFCLLIVSWQYETMSNWFYPMLYFYLIGLASGHSVPGCIDGQEVGAQTTSV